MGNKSPVSFRSAVGALRVDLERPSQVSIQHQRDADLATATHNVDVAARAETIVHLDAAQRGVGTASCGPDTLPHYLLGPGRYQWSWTLSVEPAQYISPEGTHS